MNVICYHHTHWDREWYQPFEEFRLRFIDVFEDIISELQNGNLQQFYLDGQTIALEDYLEINPDKKQLVNSLITQNKLLIGPWYVLADEFLVTAESLIRNLLIGIHQSKKLGCNNFTGYLPDAFGHDECIPQILNSFNIKNSIIWRGAGEQASEFIWQSKDGSSVIATHLIEGYFQDIIHTNFLEKEKVKTLKSLLNKIKKYSISNTLLLPIGADHLNVLKNANIKIENLNSRIKNFNLKSGSIFDYINNIDSKQLNFSIIKGELRDNSRNFILPGTFSSRLYLKQENARTTWTLSRLAEPLQTFFNTYGYTKNRTNEINHAWMLLLKNHPHDSMCGCSTDEVHQEMMTRFLKVKQISSGIISRCLFDISKLTNKQDLSVINLSSFNYSGVIKIKTNKKLKLNENIQFLNTTKEFPQEILNDINKIPVTEDIKKYYHYLINVDNLSPYSLNTIKLNKQSTENKDKLIINPNSISNKSIKVEVDEVGTLKITDLEINKTFDNLHSIENVADAGDTYNFVPLKKDKPIRAKFIKSKVIEKGHLRSILKLQYQLDIPQKLINNTKRSAKKVKHTLNTFITIHANSKRIDFKTEWENKSENHLLQLKFKLPEKVNSTISEDNIGLIKREFDADYNIKKQMPAKFKKELKTNTAPMQRFVWTEGLGIITEGLSEYEIEENNLKVTLLRATGVISKAVIPTRGLAAGPPIQTPEAQCLGKHVVKYALYLTNEPKELFKQADNFMKPILSIQGINDEKTILNKFHFLNTENENISVIAIKEAENKIGLIARIVNNSNNKQVLKLNSDAKFTSIQEVNSLETILNEKNLISQNITFKPNELKSLYFK